MLSSGCLRKPRGFVHRRAPNEFSCLEIERLAAFSKRLKLIRDKTFVHIDKDGVFDPEAIYSAAGIEPSEIIWAVEAVWTELKRFHAQRPSGEHGYKVGEDYSGDDTPCGSGRQRRCSSPQP